MELYYINSVNEKLDLCAMPYMVKDISEILDYTWDYEEKNGKITVFSRSISEIPFSINIFGDTAEEYTDACERFFAVTEYDTLTNQKGRLYYGKQYISCNLITSKKEDWNKRIPFQILNVSFVTDYPYWITENSYVFHSFGISSSFNKAYHGKYPFRYANGMHNTYVLNEHFYDTNFLLRIYGPIVNPQVSISGTPHLVNIVLEDGEYVEINSREKTVTKVMLNGTRVNAFHNRQKGADFFRKIPPGRQNIVWTGKFDFDLIIFEERSAPK